MTTETSTLPDSADAPAAEPKQHPALWEDAHPEHFTLLRLAPLPTDRASGGRPLRFVQFGRAERHNKTHSLLRLNILLPGQKTRKEQNHLDVWVDHTSRLVHFEPQAGLQVEPWNRGLGRFLMAHAVHWAQHRFGEYRLESIALAAKDALNEDMRQRRDHVLKTQGFEVVYTDPQKLKGRISETRIGNLNNTWNGDKVQIIEILEASQMLQDAEKKLLENDAELRKQEERVSKYRREDSGLRFTIACLVTFAVFQAGLLIWIATHR